MQEKSVDFDSIRLSLAGPEQVLKWSHGEVTKPETINYRTQKPEREGLFDEKIFGPVKDYECYCGKYKKIRYKGVVCDKCGVEVTKSAVRRERMGHISLAVPCSHIWYLRGVPSRLGLIFDISSRDLERVVYFGAFIIIEVAEEIKKEALEKLDSKYQSYKDKLQGQNFAGSKIIKVLTGRNKKSGEARSGSAREVSEEVKLGRLLNNYRRRHFELEELRPHKIISEERYHDLSMKHGEIVKVGIGAEAIYDILKGIDLSVLEKSIQKEILISKGQKLKRLSKRLKLIKDLKNNNMRPDWMMVKELPVIPPDLRPMVQLDGGRFAASDLNDLYRRVINRNNRLKRLKLQGAPEVIQRNEKRMLQEAVDALIDNSARRDKAAQTVGGRRKLRSLSDMLRGKQGRFRQNLLGKRVDYSGRSVIVIGPELKLNQCGLPKVMALELFKPFIIGRLITLGFAHNVKNASKMIEQEEPAVWDILEEITKDHLVLLNRAPTLHRLGVQAFQPVLIEGKAIRIHPLVCAAYNADFDGDQMAVYIPLSTEAQDEAKTMMLASKNLLKPASGEPIVGPSRDIVFGIYYLTLMQRGGLGDNKYFESIDEAIIAHRNGYVGVRAKINVLIGGKIIKTTVGRILFNQILPQGFKFINSKMDRKTLNAIVKESFVKYGKKTTALLVDKIKDLGFYYSTHSGMTIAAVDIKVPANKPKVIAEADAKVLEIEEQYEEGLITDDERYLKIIELWSEVKSRLEREMVSMYKATDPVFAMINSGARGNLAQMTQLGAMKGLVVNPSGEIIEQPVKGNYLDGLESLEYFFSTHAARKGRSDTALRTAEAGYLTRRLIDVAQDVIITTYDCGDKEGSNISVNDVSEFGQSFKQKIIGRVAAKLIKDKNLRTIVAKNQMIDEPKAAKIEQGGIGEVTVFSPLTCKNTWGICQKCYGRDLATGELVATGTAVGVIAAQAIGEPGTQLTMRTFHIGGVVGLDITSGLPRVEELFEARLPKMPAILAEFDGVVEVKEFEDKKVIHLSSVEQKTKRINLLPGFKLKVRENQKVDSGRMIAARGKEEVHAPFAGRIHREENSVLITSDVERSSEYTVSALAAIKIKSGDKVIAGDILTEGQLDLRQTERILGQVKTQKYIVSEIQAIYSSQGQSINDKHFDVIVRQMFSKIGITSPGDTEFLAGQIVDRQRFYEVNASVKSDKIKAVGQELLLGVTKVALSTNSFLSAASFQETTGVLMEAATTGKIDKLRGLKENVIIGRMIPAGTGFRQKFGEQVKEEVAREVVRSKG
ncbi:MAG: DNA-directed RNA polymerase subunit beta' [Candidatus Berkelbacteria bacterium Licking1014_96]|uniref:DNA-directed RNA polymerase subunit beta' n=1 Tax=Candidatus Berkelbacteria bacterium Licking1014_96 TaxID=2017149 RepID=A0A554LHE2_9BACT|nr:MAG: DNA-directed RNA polymerase subunit beta' [Candidatus Berkelbacteria bacterium Licking1014_96]